MRTVRIRIVRRGPQQPFGHTQNALSTGLGFSSAGSSMSMAFYFRRPEKKYLDWDDELGGAQFGSSSGDGITVFGATSAVQKRFDDGIKELIERLKNKECADLFGGAKNAKKILKKLSFASDSMAKNVAMTYARETNLVKINGESIFMADRGYVPFVDVIQTHIPDENDPEPRYLKFNTFLEAAVPVNTQSGIKGLNLRSDVKTAAFLLMHELAHAVGAFGDTDTDGFDPLATNAENAKHANNQRLNNMKVWEACFKNEGTLSELPQY